MTEFQTWLLIATLTIILNTVPLFMPPTWVLLAYFNSREGYEIWQLALVGAISAAIGRAILALGSREIGLRVLPPRWRSNIEELGDQLERHKNLSLSAFTLFMLGPLPSNQLFIAIGVGRMPIFVPLVLFAASRFVGYMIWITTASVVATSLADIVKPSLGGTVSIIAQIVGVLALIGVMQVDWRRIVQNRQAKASGKPTIDTNQVAPHSPSKPDAVL